MSYFVYLLARKRDGTLYLGVTGHLARRVHQHRTKELPGFSARYEVDRLVWYEEYPTALEAIAREKAMKKWRRSWKTELIEAGNPDWKDLYEGLA